MKKFVACLLTNSFFGFALSGADRVEVADRAQSKTLQQQLADNAHAIKIEDIITNDAHLVLESAIDTINNHNQLTWINIAINSNAKNCLRTLLDKFAEQLTLEQKQELLFNAQQHSACLNILNTHHGFNKNGQVQLSLDFFKAQLAQRLNLEWGWTNRQRLHNFLLQAQQALSVDDYNALIESDKPMAHCACSDNECNNVCCTSTDGCLCCKAPSKAHPRTLYWLNHGVSCCGVDRDNQRVCCGGLSAGATETYKLLAPKEEQNHCVCCCSLPPAPTPPEVFHCMLPCPKCPIC